METNALPDFDNSINTTGCCPKFNPTGWDDQDLHLKDYPFVRATTKSLMHIPVNMGRVFSRVQKHMDAAGAFDPDHTLVLTQDLSAWQAEHFFAVTKPVPEEDMATLTGDFITKVFDGPYAKAKDWYAEMQALVRKGGHEPGRVFFFYTTCPKCAKAYGKNYIVGVAEVTKTGSAVF